MEESNQKRSQFRQQIRKRHLHQLFQNIRNQNKQLERLHRQSNTEISVQQRQEIKQKMKKIIGKCIIFYHIKNYKNFMDQMTIVQKMIAVDPRIVSVGLEAVFRDFGDIILQTILGDVDGRLLEKISLQLGVAYQSSTIAQQGSNQTNTAITLTLLQISQNVEYNKFPLATSTLLLKPLYSILENPEILPSTLTSTTHFQILTCTLKSLCNILEGPNHKQIKKKLQHFGLSKTLNQIVDHSVEYHRDVHAVILKLVYLYNKSSSNQNLQDTLNGITIINTDSEYKQKFVVYSIFILKKKWRNTIDLALMALNQIFQQCPYFIDSIKTDYYDVVLEFGVDLDRKINVTALNLVGSLAFYSQSASDQLIQKSKILDFLYTRLLHQRSLPQNDPYTKQSIQKCTNIICDLLLTKNQKLKKLMFNHNIWQLINQSMQQNNRLFHTVIVFKYFFATMPRKQRNAVLPAFLEAVRNLPLQNQIIQEIREIKETLVNVFYHSLEHNSEELHDQIVRLFQVNGLIKYIEDYQIGLQKQHKMEST